jgi:redox-sensitive bicupin YhaK (pirin superfamily)
MVRGVLEHRDSLGNVGVLGEGDVQWMTAGSGIVHQEMPEGDDSGGMGGFQLWVNLPAEKKMTDPVYRSISFNEIPIVRTSAGASVRVIAGEAEGTRGPVRGTATDVGFVDIMLPRGVEYVHAVEEGHTAFAYVHGGSVELTPTVSASNRDAVLFGDGDHVSLVGGSDEPARLLLLSGRPLREPIAWRGPVVMNSEEDAADALREYREGTFVRVGSVPGSRSS